MPRGRKVKETEDTKKLHKAGDESATQSNVPAPKKPTAKRTAPRKKSDEKAMAETIILQSAGVEWNVAELRKKVIDAYVSEGHRQGWIKTLELYVKPEDRKVYYVINGKTTGSVNIE